MQRSDDIEQNEQIRRLKRNVVIAFAVAIFGPVVSIATVVIAGFQLDVMKEQLADARTAGAEAKEQAKETLRLDQRAWVGVTAVSGEPIVGQPWTINVGLINTGRTPAFIVRMATVADPVEQGHEPGFAYEKTFSGGVLPPNQVRTTIMVPSGAPPGTPGMLTDEAWRRIKSGQTVMYVHGRVDYADVFGENHWIRFCYFYRPGFGYGTCATHNDVDKPKS